MSIIIVKLNINEHLLWAGHFIYISSINLFYKPMSWGPYDSHFTTKNTEVWKSEVTCLSSGPKLVGGGTGIQMLWVGCWKPCPLHICWQWCILLAAAVSDDQSGSESLQLQKADVETTLNARMLLPERY